MYAPVHGRSARYWPPVGLAAVVILHALIFWVLSRMNVIRLPTPLATLTVDLIKPPEEVKPPEPPPRPRPVRKRPEPVDNHWAALPRM